MSKREEDIVEIYDVLCDLRYLLHKELNTVDDYKKSFEGYYWRVAKAAKKAEELLPDKYKKSLREL